jgi:HK97 family phage major capsid protein
MATLAGTEGVIAAFGDFKAGYHILDHSSGMTVQRLVELYAESGLAGFKVHKRVGGYCIRPANRAIVLLTEHA